MSKVLVRGLLHISIPEAKNLKNTDLNINPFKKNVSDASCEIKICNHQLLVTKVINNSLDPKWYSAKSVVPLCYPEGKLTLNVWDCDHIGKDLIGEATISLRPLNEKWQRNDWISLRSNRGLVLVGLKFIPFSSNEEKVFIEPLDIDYLYFEPRKGGSLQLYQDAHAPAKRNLFEDIVKTIEKANRFIYVSGWSVWTELEMKRDGDKRTIGELLKWKADQGVRVLVLIWNEKFSARLCSQLVGTHDSATLKFFSKTNVTAVAVRRKPDGHSELKEHLIETIYTHHIKTIVADCPKKGLQGYIGGLDLTDGRWDTPEHSLWSTLVTSHKTDFRNAFTDVTDKTGPREPWHDVHAAVDGYAALDLLQIFEERWKKQATDYVQNLIPFTEAELTQYMENAPKYGKIWHMQVLRSADSDSCLFKPKSSGLISFGNRTQDCSVHNGIIGLIRSCKKFIYIETQYLTGSALYWNRQSDTCAFNLVPVEICEQIVSRIATFQ